MEIFQPKSAVSTTSTVSGTLPDIPMYADTKFFSKFPIGLKGQSNNQRFQTIENESLHGI
jgi:hypothetical protein